MFGEDNATARVAITFCEMHHGVLAHGARVSRVRNIKLARPEISSRDPAGGKMCTSTHATTAHGRFIAGVVSQCERKVGKVAPPFGSVQPRAPERNATTRTARMKAEQSLQPWLVSV